MFKKLFPRNDNFFTFFEKHAAMSVQAAYALLKFMQPGSDLEAGAKEIKHCEQEGDRITHQCIEALHKSFITPLERSDIHHLISTMDDVLDEIEDVSKFILLYKLPVFPEGSQKLAKVLLDSVVEMEKAIKELRKMKNTDTLQKIFYNINHLENEGDMVFLHSLGTLFDEEKSTLNILKWREVYEHLEHAIDACEDVGNILEGIVLEYD